MRKYAAILLIALTAACGGGNKQSACDKATESLQKGTSKSIDAPDAAFDKMDRLISKAEDECGAG